MNDIGEKPRAVVDAHGPNAPVVAGSNANTGADLLTCTSYRQHMLALRISQELAAAIKVDLAIAY
ncbi:MAG: hypothetical protein ACR2PG_00745 [Hyphomicrobiaceae bacterium]